MRRKNSPLRVAIDNCGAVVWPEILDAEMIRRLQLKDNPMKKEHK